MNTSLLVHGEKVGAADRRVVVVSGNHAVLTVVVVAVECGKWGINILMESEYYMQYLLVSR